MEKIAKANKMQTQKLTHQATLSQIVHDEMKKSEAVKEEQKMKKSLTSLPSELEIVSGLAQIKTDEFGTIDASFGH